MHRVVAVASVAALIVAGCRGRKPEPPPPLGPPEFRFTIEEFEKECKDSKAAEAKLGGRVVEVSGTVESASRTGDGDEYGLVTFASPSGALLGAACLFYNTEIAAELGRGQSVKVKGVFSPFLISRRLVRCEVVEKGPDTIVRVTGEQLSAEYTADAEAFALRYDKKSLLVSAEVAAVKSDENRVPYLELRGDGQSVVEVRYMSFDRKLPAEYHAGDRVRFVASTFSLRHEKGRTLLLIDVPLGPE